MTSACGHVLAEVLKGVRPSDGGGKLHSIATRLLPLLLNFLTADTAAGLAGTALASFLHALGLLLKHCGPKQAHLLWALPAQRLANAQPLEAERLCQLIQAVTDFRNGAAVTDVCAGELLQVRGEWGGGRKTLPILANYGVRPLCFFFYLGPQRAISQTARRLRASLDGDRCGSSPGLLQPLPFSAIGE